MTAGMIVSRALEGYALCFAVNVEGTMEEMGELGRGVAAGR